MRKGSSLKVISDVYKRQELGAKVITMSGPDGYIYDPDGISGEKIDYMLELRSSGNDIVAPYAEQYPNATFVYCSA